MNKFKILNKINSSNKLNLKFIIKLSKINFLHEKIKK